MKNNHPLVTAHSGCLDTEPNSLSHVQAALQAGADLVEVDVRHSRGRLVLSHDAEFTDPLTLDDVWDLVIGSGAGFNLDIKEEAALEPLAAFLASRSPLFGVVTGCGVPWVGRLRALAPAVTVLFNVERGPENETLEAWQDRMVVEARRCGAAGLNADHRLVGEGLVRLARRSSMPVFVWTANDEASLKRLGELGLDGVTTDRLDLAHRILTGF
jgi:glycerophosphoryl diester phosphodiesterase